MEKLLTVRAVLWVGCLAPSLVGGVAHGSHAAGERRMWTQVASSSLEALLSLSRR